jgi:hypothetical protein
MVTRRHYVRTWAEFSPLRTHRWVLGRELDVRLDLFNRGDAPCVFIMVNPSDANAEDDDPTIIRCVEFCRGWGYRRLYVLNLFAHVSSKVFSLREVVDPVGAHNDAWIRRTLDNLGPEALVIAAWGARAKWSRVPGHRDRHEKVIELVTATHALHALDFTAEGDPRHPLFLRRALAPTVWRARR